MVAIAREMAGEDAIITIVSDHGAKPVTPLFNEEERYAGSLPNQVLQKEGLLVRDSAGKVDWSRTKAYGGHGGVWINVKGRDPQGTVRGRSEEYEELRDRILDLMLDLRSPLSGRHLFNCVCRKEAARPYGMGTVGDPDILCFNLEPVDKRENKVTQEQVTEKLHVASLGTWEQPKFDTGNHNLVGILQMSGPGLRKGYRRDKPVWLSYAAPTLCYFWGIPAPSNADGGIIWDFLSNWLEQRETWTAARC